MIAFDTKDKNFENFHNLSLVMKFTPELLQQAKKAMENLSIHPISQQFEDPITDINENVVLKNPISLKIIRDRLKSNYYTDTYQWLCDVETVFHNFEINYTETSLEATLAREMRKIFNKERRFLMKYSYSLWTTNMHALRVKLVKCVHLAPSKLKTHIPLFTFVELPKPRQLSFSSHDIQSFQLASEMLVSEEEKKGLYDIINESQPDAFQNVNNLSLNIGHLTDQTLRSLRDYIATCLAKRNISYLE